MQGKGVVTLLLVNTLRRLPRAVGVSERQGVLILPSLLARIRLCL